MPINVGEALDSDTAVSITVERRSGGDYIDGIYAEGSIRIFKTLCSPQQPSPQDLQTLPEGERDKDLFKFITNKLLRTGSDRDTTQADVLIFKGNRFKIIAVGDWDTFGQTTSIGAKL